MAQYTRKMKYGQRAVNGSLAYDFNNPELYPDYTEVQVPPRPKTRERVEPVATPGTAVRTKQALAPLALIGYACAAVLLVFALMAQINLSTLSTETVRLENQLAELQRDEAKLLIAYESAFNLSEIEDYAITQLGMQKPRSDQVFYVDNSAPDKAVIIEPKEDRGGILGKIGETFELFRQFLAR